MLAGDQGEFEAQSLQLVVLQPYAFAPTRAAASQPHSPPPGQTLHRYESSAHGYPPSRRLLSGGLRLLVGAQHEQRFARFRTTLPRPAREIPQLSKARLIA